MKVRFAKVFTIGTSWVAEDFTQAIRSACMLPNNAFQWTPGSGLWRCAALFGAGAAHGKRSTGRGNPAFPLPSPSKLA